MPVVIRTPRWHARVPRLVWPLLFVLALLVAAVFAPGWV